MESDLEDKFLLPIEDVTAEILPELDGVMIIEEMTLEEFHRRYPVFKD